jgi:tetratricopeptide (TPR) repeat protein
VILRTSETLARDTVALKPDGGPPVPHVVGEGISDYESKLRASLAGDPGSFEANHRLGEFYLQAGRYREAIPLLQSAYQIDSANYGNEYSLAIAYKEASDLPQARDCVQRLLAHQEKAELHRLAGEVDEGLGDPLAAVHEFEQAARLEASEQNYFEWGSELLLHRAVWQAQEVFKKGTEAYPKSVRMLTALGTALFAGAKYDEAALRLCQASDLSPADREPYIFLGKIELAAPAPLPCVEAKLSQFAQAHPENSLANYFYAMAILKRQKQPADAQDLRQAEALLNRAVTVDNKCADAYLQLGNLQTTQHNFDKAIALYSKAIEANPKLGDAHYRLGVAYDRTGEHAKATQEFQQHDEIEKEQATEVERQRREVKQFTVVLEGQPKYPQVH